MNLFYRRITYITFIIIFFIVTPLILLYTQGYRFNLSKGRIQKTGILIVSSNPRSAAIYLNGKLMEKIDTPARLEHLLPGDYEIKLTKDGYHDWHKKLPINDNSTTFAEKIILWKNELPIPLAAKNIIDWQAAPDGKRVIYLTANNEIELLNLDSDKISSLKKVAGDNLKILSWSNNGRKVMVESQNPSPKYFIFDTERPDNEPVTVSNNILPAEKANLKWDLASDNLIYSLNKQGLWQFDLFQKKSRLFLNVTSTQNFLVTNNVYLFKNKTLYRRPIIDLGRINEEVIAENIRCDDCSFINQAASKLFLFNPENQNLIIVDPENRNLMAQYAAKDIAWLNKETMLFYNDWEIWLYDLNKKEPELITRLGQPISRAVWHPDGKHIIFATGDTINVIELDDRELRNIIILASIKGIKNLEIKNDGQNLYFTANLGGQENIFKLEIR